MASAGLAKQSAADHSDIRNRSEVLAPLLQVCCQHLDASVFYFNFISNAGTCLIPAVLSQVLKALRQSSMPPLRERYCSAINSLLRRELRGSAADLRKSVSAAVSASSQYADILNVTRYMGSRLHLLLPVESCCAVAWTRPL